MAANPKRITTFAQAALYTVIVIGILGAINFLANRYNKSADTTANKRYTLSDQTNQIAKGLKQDVKISYWDRPDTFSPAKDLLDRYELLSPHIQVVYQDVDKNRTEAIAAKITARPSITVETGNKNEQAKSLTEEEVTGAMVRALKGGDRTVCFTKGYGDVAIEATDGEGYSEAKQWAERDNYKTQSVNLPATTIPAECTVLVVGGPKRDYLDTTVNAIKTYVENGGHALILLDPPLKFGSQVDDNAGLVKILETWGVRLNSDLVLDPRGQQVGLGAQFPVAGDYGDHVITRALKSQGIGTVFPIARSMQAAGGGTAEVQPLVMTSPGAFLKTDLKTPNMPPANTSTGTQILAMAGTLREGGKGRFVTVGTSAWINNGGIRLSANRDLYMNMINWLSSDEDLISIRPKDPEDRRLNMNARQMNFMAWQSLLILPALMFLAGLSVWWRRR